MAELYTSLNVTPRKKRCPPVSDDDDDAILTPKRIRRRPLSPPATHPRKKAAPPSLPPHLARLHALQGDINRAISHALATSAVSPSEDTGIVSNVLNHFNLTSAVGLGTSCSLDDIKRLCWLWEWDGKALPEGEQDEIDDFFAEGSSMKKDHPKQWSRGGMGLVITPTTYLPKASTKRAAAYGIGIEVEMDIDKGMVGGMAAVARWTAGGEQRLKELSTKLHRWVHLHIKRPTVPAIPLADLPPLVLQAPKQSALTERLSSLSPKSPKTFSTPRSALPQPPSSPSRSLSLSPTKPRTGGRIIAAKGTPKEFAIPFPITPVSLHRSGNKSNAAMLQTPSTSRTIRLDVTPSRTPKSSIAFPSTPSTLASSSRPVTPVKQLGDDAETVPETPTSRRAALYERIRKRSESQAPPTPSKSRIATTPGMTKDQLLKLTQDDMRRRCLLGRLSGVAESIWMLFNSPSPTSLSTPSSSSNPSPRKRRTLPLAEVLHAIVKSSPVPISSADAQESLEMLQKLCPEFLKVREVGREEWVEVGVNSASASSSTSGSTSVPSTPSKKGRMGSGKGLMVDECEEEELRTLSPKRITKREGFGLREVRERIKRELEDTD